MFRIAWSIVIGFIIGMIARAIMPGAQQFSFTVATLLGIAGSIVGGLIGGSFSKPRPGIPFHPAHIVMSMIGALVLLCLWTAT
jgi:uncharacterized membrane protein YeaQ/YmgE (transglycosylase-associated protein family)